MPWRGPEVEGEYPTLGYEIGAWIEANCVIPDGIYQGEPFKLTDEMWKFLFRFYRLKVHARRNPERPSAAFFNRGGLLMRPQKWGKGPFAAAVCLAEAFGPVRFDGWDDDGEPIGVAQPTPWIQIVATSEEQPLALDTEVPTPDGWATIGSLQVGDHVFDDLGMPCRVVRQTPVLFGEQCYRVTFSDGEEIVASAGHGWTLDRRTRHGDRRERVTVTTAELSSDYLSPSGAKRYRHEVGTAWSLPDRDLPVDPYLLGLWLGDGATGDARIVYDLRRHDEVEAIVAPLLQPHETIVWTAGAGNVGMFRIRRHPGICAWGHSFDGDLLDGTCGPCRRLRRRGVSPATEAGARLSSFRERLRDIGVLGDKHIPVLYLRASAKQRLALLQGLMDSDGHIEANGRAGFTNVNQRLIDGAAEILTSLGYQWNVRRDRTVNAWRLFFVPDEEPVARLLHKVSRQRPRTGRASARFRYVARVEAVDSVPVRCVGIDTPSHLFLVGRRAVPTHNTDNTWLALYEMARRGPVADIPGIDIGVEDINLPSGGKIEPRTSSGKARLGARLTFAVF